MPLIIWHGTKTIKLNVIQHETGNKRGYKPTEHNYSCKHAEKYAKTKYLSVAYANVRPHKNCKLCELVTAASDAT
eukprot:1198925-Amphidinium_carterae.1